MDPILLYCLAFAMGLLDLHLIVHPITDLMREYPPSVERKRGK